MEPVKYFTHEQGARLFRLAQDGTSQRWDAKASTWRVLSSDLLYRETVVRPNPDYVEVSEQEAGNQFPDALQQQAPVEEVSEQDIDWPFTVEMMGKIMAAAASDYDPAQFVADHAISDAVAPYVVRFWNMIRQASSELPAGQSISPPTEWN